MVLHEKTIEQSKALWRFERISSTIIDKSNGIHILTSSSCKNSGNFVVIEEQQLSSRDHFFMEHALASHNSPNKFTSVYHSPSRFGRDNREMHL